jgi:hypothetical protein
MAIKKLSTIKSWFRTGLKPTQSQFWDTWDSFRHKCEKVPVEDIEGIEELLTGDKIIQSGQFIVFKVSPNTANELEIGDTVIGYCEGNFLGQATYYGGDTSLMTSFTESNNLVGRIISFVNNHVLTIQLNDEVLQRAYSCGAYSGIVLMYKRPGEFEFSSAWPTGSYPELWISWLELTPGSILKLRDTIGGLNDSKEFIV